MREKRIRLAFVLPHLRMGGVETVVCNLVKALDRTAFEPVLALKQLDGELLAKLPADCIPETLGEGRASMLVPALRRFVLQGRPDAVYSATSAINLACMAAARTLPRRARPAMIAGEHTLPEAYLAQAKWPALRRTMTRLLYPQADAIAVPTEDIGLELRHLLSGRCPPIHVLPNPVLDSSTIERRAVAAAQPKEGMRFVAAGRLVDAKAFDVLIAAFARVARQLPSCRLTIYGEGPERTPLRALAHDLGVGDRVDMPGNVDGLVDRLASHDIFVLSSRREGFGNVVVEAMAAGLPVVAADQAGPRALLDGGKYGLVVPADAVDPLADAMADLARRDDLRLEFAAAGLQRCRAFEIGIATRQFERSVAGLCAAHLERDFGAATDARGRAASRGRPA